MLHLENSVSEAGQPHTICASRELLCPHCQVPLVADPTGPWSPRCRRAWPGSPVHARCTNTADATANTPRTRGMRLCHTHARLLVDAAGPGAAIPDTPPY